MRPILLLVLLGFSNPGCTQGFFNFKGKEKHRASINYPYVRSYLYDAKDIAFAPIRWKEKQWGTAFALTSATAMAMFFDKPIAQWVQAHRSPVSNAISKYGLEPIGGGIYSAGIIGVTYIGGLVFKDQHAKKVAMLATKAFALAVAGSFVPKYVFQRERPYEAAGMDPYRFHWIVGDASHNSFISGHTIQAWAVATVYAREYRHKKWVGVLAYSLATLAGLSRVHDNAHWMSDVVGGAALGYAFGSLISNRNNWGVEISPYRSGQSLGLGLNFSPQFIRTQLQFREWNRQLALVHPGQF
ncbi:MAG: phosphatase PAP2 family protein [Bacteroidia bacterium]|nr:phosphatase PAP2 family protein [Bacteroidia bacterium]